MKIDNSIISMSIIANIMLLLIGILVQLKIILTALEIQVIMLTLNCGMLIWLKDNAVH